MARAQLIVLFGLLFFVAIVGMATAAPEEAESPKDGGDSSDAPSSEASAGPDGAASGPGSDGSGSGDAAAGPDGAAGGPGGAASGSACLEVPAVAGVAVAAVVAGYVF